jgi:hypothetical protein
MTSLSTTFRLQCLPCASRERWQEGSLCLSRVFLAGAYVLALADSGATDSSASFDYLHTHNTSFDPVSVPAARLANGRSLGIKGITRLIEVKFAPFRFKHRF